MLMHRNAQISGDELLLCVLEQMSIIHNREGF